MNYLILTIDALSKWYIDKLKKNSFFEVLEKDTYCFNNLFSLGPFTEAAVRGFWAGEKPLTGYSYLCQTLFKDDTFFAEYEPTHYMYYGKFVLFADYEQRIDNAMKREKFEEKGFYVAWSNRLKNISNYTENDLWEVEFVLDHFFEGYKKVDAINKEKKKYEQNKIEYINDIMLSAEKSSFYQNIADDYITATLYRNIRNITNQKNHVLTAEEAVFIKKAKNKNIEFALNNSNNILSDVEKLIGPESNRSITANNDLLCHMRDEYETFPKLGEEISEFFNWYDSVGKGLDKPFFAYIHNMDFHYPENFMNSRVDSVSDYKNEILQLTDMLDTLEDSSVSVSKQLSLKMIEKNLEYLWNELERRKIFDNTCVIITADHGIPNMMNPVSNSNSRWSGTRTNLNIPLYIKSPNVRNHIDNRLIGSDIFKGILQDINQGSQIDGFDFDCEKKYFFTSWINGLPDIKRNPIKITIRDDNWSITCDGYYFQTFSSLHILSIYNLQEDYDEIHNVAYVQAKQNESFLALMNSMGEEWYAVLSELYSDQLFLNAVSNAGEYVSILTENRERFSRDKRISKGEFDKKASERRLIVYVDDLKMAKEMLCALPDECELLEIWSDKSDISQICGNKCVSPHDTEGEFQVVVCANDEIRAVQKMKDLNIKNYILWKNVSGRFSGI